MSAADRPVRVFISAGEVSGDVLGGRLATALRARCTTGIELAGVGGEALAGQGLKSLFPISDLAVMGLFEVLPHIPKLARRIRETAKAISEFNPDVLVTIDAPGFNKRLAAACGRTRFPKVHYVAPTVWAWRPNRVHSFNALYDKLLCLLPFEPPYFEAVGLDADFVGHSVLESGAASGVGAAFRRDWNIPSGTPLICVLPGSRRSEVDRLLADFRDTLGAVSAHVDGLQAVMPAVPHLAIFLQDRVRNWPVPVSIVANANRKFDAMAACQAALAASGTVTLDLAMAKVPTVVAYRLNPLTYRVARRMVKTKYVHLLNILANEEIVPERIQRNCTPGQLTSELLTLLGTAGAEQTTQLAPHIASLSPEGGALPSEAAAAAVLAAVGKRHTPFPG